MPILPSCCYAHLRVAFFGHPKSLLEIGLPFRPPSTQHRRRPWNAHARRRLGNKDWWVLIAGGSTNRGEAVGVLDGLGAFGMAVVKTIEARGLAESIGGANPERRSIAGQLAMQ